MPHLLSDALSEIKPKLAKIDLSFQRGLEVRRMGAATRRFALEILS